MLTTISVFSILSFSDFLGFAEFGKIATIGIISAFFTYIFVFPAQTIFYDRVAWLGKPKPRLFVFKIYDLYASTPYFISLGFLVVLVISLFLLPHVQFEYDFQKLRGDSPAAEYETKTTDEQWELRMLLSKIKEKKEQIFNAYIKNCLVEAGIDRKSVV